jgi:hypothetical protein
MRLKHILASFWNLFDSFLEKFRRGPRNCLIKIWVGRTCLLKSIISYQWSDQSSSGPVGMIDMLTLPTPANPYTF